MLSTFAAVMTFGCRPPVSHGLAANAAPAAGRRPRPRSVCQPTLLVYTCTLKEGVFEKKIPGNGVKPQWAFFSQGQFSKLYLRGRKGVRLTACTEVSMLKWFSACTGFLYFLLCQCLRLFCSCTTGDFVFDICHPLI